MDSVDHDQYGFTIRVTMSQRRMVRRLEPIRMHAYHARPCCHPTHYTKSLAESFLPHGEVTEVKRYNYTHGFLNTTPLFEWKLVNAAFCMRRSA